jgi:hypothetical protein
MALAGIYSKEIKELSEMGANLIQIEEPLIAQYPQDIELLRGSLEIISKGLQSEVLLGLYFADAVPLLEKLVELPVPGLLFDLLIRETYSTLLRFSQKYRTGIIDGRNTRWKI